MELVTLSPYVNLTIDYRNPADIFSDIYNFVAYLHASFDLKTVKVCQMQPQMQSNAVSQPQPSSQPCEAHRAVLTNHRVAATAGLSATRVSVGPHAVSSVGLSAAVAMASLPTRHRFIAIRCRRVGVSHGTSSPEVPGSRGPRLPAAATVRVRSGRSVRGTRRFTYPLLRGRGVHRTCSQVI